MSVLFLHHHLLLGQLLTFVRPSCDTYYSYLELKPLPQHFLGFLINLSRNSSSASINELHRSMSVSLVRSLVFATTPDDV